MNMTPYHQPSLWTSKKLRKKWVITLVGKLLDIGVFSSRIHKPFVIEQSRNAKSSHTLETSQLFSTPTTCYCLPQHLCPHHDAWWLSAWVLSGLCLIPLTFASRPRILKEQCSWAQSLEGLELWLYVERSLLLHYSSLKWSSFFILGILGSNPAVILWLISYEAASYPVSDLKVLTEK